MLEKKEGKSPANILHALAEKGCRYKEDEVS
jgi:hypothetical protein